jgi:hypothetical protein
MIYKKIEKYLLGFDVKIKDVSNQFKLKDNSDGNGAFIASWNVQGITKPTNAQLSEISDESILLEEAKTAKITQITPVRDAFMYADIEYNGSFFTNSLISGNNITAALAIMGTSINWLDTSGNQVVMTKAQLKELGALILNKRSAGYYKEATLIEQINACTTLEEVEAVDINF